MARLLANGFPEDKTILVAGERIHPHYRQNLYDLAVHHSDDRSAKELWFLVRNRSAHVKREHPGMLKLLCRLTRRTRSKAILL